MTIVADAPRHSPNGPERIPAPPGTARLTRASAADLGRHLADYGPLPAAPGSAALLETLSAAGLEGRGGAGFPAWRKLAAMPVNGHAGQVGQPGRAGHAGQPGRAGRSGRAGRTRPVLIGNAAEGEPLSLKDATLLHTTPHLVLDGLLTVAAAIDAAEVYLYAPAALLPYLGRALAERTDAGGVQLRAAAETFISGEASAVVNALAGRPAVPRDRSIRLTAAGLGGRPTLLHNIETLAQIALILRFGAVWFRSLGTDTDPGTRLVTVSRGLAAAGVPAGVTGAGAGTAADAPLGATATVLEVVGGSHIDEVLGFAGVDPGTVAAVLVGGYHGAWLPATALHTGLDRVSLAPFGASPGAGILLALEAGRCPLTLAAAIADYLAGQSARQCGPCVNGLPAMASVLGRLAAGDRDPRLPGEVARLAALVTGRGSCHHPDGTARFVLSTLTVFQADVTAHLRGSCGKAHE